jgi:type I restriction enzyme S subunit
MDTKKLRQKILDLAIHGKLVPQDPNDEPASVLLERIRAEKERLVKEGKIKKSKSSRTTDTPHYENIPFEVPDGWGWTTVENICSKIGSGSTPKGSNYAPDGILFFRSQNVYNDGVVLEDIKYISEEVHQSMIGTEVLPNDLLLNITGGSLGRCAIVPNEIDRGNVSQHVCILRPIIIKPEYLHTFILSSFFTKTMKITGSGREGLPKYNLEKMLLPVPPLEEQTRIIHELNKWNDWVIAIDNNQQDLVETIKQTKSKILDLAIHGKLVPQDENDEPASKLLKRINPAAEITCDNGHYQNLPKGWGIIQYKDVVKNISSKLFQILQSEIKDNGTYPVVSQSANYIEGYSDNIEKLYKSEESIIFGDHTRNVKYLNFPFIVGADGVKILQTKLYCKYVYYFTAYASDNLIEDKGYSRHYGQLSQLNIPIPPYKEQQRIVEVINLAFKHLDTIMENL